MRRPAGWSTRRIVLLGSCAVVGLALVGVLGVAIGGTGGGSESVSALPTTGEYLPLTVPKQQYRLGVDPDSTLKSGNDLVTVLSRPGSHRYRLTISNNSTIGVINSLNWSPPPGMTISKVTSSTGGECELSGTPGYGGKQFSNVVANVRISCGGINLKPPTCTCRGDGGEVVVTFIATSTAQGFLAGSTSIVSATPTRGIIPGYVQTPDVPACAKGQVSTATSPCSTGS